MEGPADTARYHMARGGGEAAPGCAFLAPGLRGCLSAASRDAQCMEELYRACGETGPRHHFLVATDHEAELWDNRVALVADLAQCLAPHATILLREGWEGQQYSRTPATPLVAQNVELGGSEFVYLDRSVEQDVRHWTAHHLLAPNVQMTVDPLGLPTLAGRPPQWTCTWDMAVNTLRMAPREQRTVWPGAENVRATARAAQVRQPTGNTKDCGVCTLCTVSTLLRVPRPGNLLSTLDKRCVAAVALKRDMGPVAHLPSLGELPAAVLDALSAPRSPLPVADIAH